jgi:DNA-binding NtrC family response regulator
LYRLNALTIRIPALRERGDDVVLIAQAMLERFARDYGRGHMRLLEEARQALRRHSWPGNVRELINVVQRVAMLSERPEVSAADLGLPGAPRAKAVALGNGAALQPAAEPESEATQVAGSNGSAEGLVFDFDAGVHKADDVERELIVQALKRTHGNVSKAAKLIGMQRSSFRYRIERYGLHEMVQEIANR